MAFWRVIEPASHSMVHVTRARTATTRSEVGVTSNAMVNIDIILFVTDKENVIYLNFLMHTLHACIIII